MALILESNPIRCRWIKIKLKVEKNYNDAIITKNIINIAHLLCHYK